MRSHEVQRQLIARHAEFTESPYAWHLLNQWESTIRHFWKVIPHSPQANFATWLLRLESVKIIAA